MFKRIVLTILISMMLINTADSEKEKRHFLKPGDKVITEQQVLNALNDTDWKKRREFLKKWSKKIRNEDYLINDIKIKLKMIQLLKEAHNYRESEINKFIEKGVKPIDAPAMFDSEGRDFNEYIYWLSSLIWDCNDPATIPLIIKTESMGGSEEYTLKNYLHHFNKNALEWFVKVAKEGNPREKVRAYGYLGAWVGETLRKRQGKEMNISQGNLLKQDEIENIKTELIEGLKTDNPAQVHMITYGLRPFVEEPRNNQEKKEIKNVLKRYLTYQEGYVREDVAKFIGEVGDRFDIADLEKLNNDPELDSVIEADRRQQIKEKGKSDLPKIYPVREAAREAIEKIKAREAGKKDPSN